MATAVDAQHTHRGADTEAHEQSPVQGQAGRQAKRQEAQSPVQRHSAEEAGSDSSMIQMILQHISQVSPCKQGHQRFGRIGGHLCFPFERGEGGSLNGQKSSWFRSSISVGVFLGNETDSRERERRLTTQNAMRERFSGSYACWHQKMFEKVLMVRICDGCSRELIHSRSLLASPSPPIFATRARPAYGAG